jgi:hypothetical protein
MDKKIELKKELSTNVDSILRYVVPSTIIGTCISTILFNKLGFFNGIEDESRILMIISVDLFLIVGKYLINKFNIN